MRADRRRTADRAGHRLLSRTARRRDAAPAARAARRAARARRCPTPRSCGSCARSASTVTADRRRLGRRRVPTFRVDLLREVDLIEEVGRHYGFDKLEPTFPVDDAAGAGAGPANPARPAGAAGADRRRAVRSGDLRLHRSERRRAPFARRTAMPRTLVAGGQPAVGQVRHAPAVAAARAGRRASRTTGATAGATSACSRSARASRRATAKRRGVGVAWTGAAHAGALVGAVARGRFLRRQGRGRAALRRRSACRSGSSRRRVPFLVAGPDGVDRSPATRRGRRRRTARAGDRRRARRAAAGPDLRRRARSRSAGARRESAAPMRCGRCRAIRSSSAICRSSSPTPCLRKSFVAPFRRPAAQRRRAARWRSAFFDRYKGKGVPRRIGQPVGAADVPGCRSHADRRRGAAERSTEFSRRWSQRARRGATIDDDRVE